MKHKNVYFSFFLQQNFKWEEQNFVVQNEINNLVFLVRRGKVSEVSGIDQSANWHFDLLHNALVSIIDTKEALQES